MMPTSLPPSLAGYNLLSTCRAAAAGVQIFATSDRRSLSLPLFVRTRVGAVLCPGSRLEFSGSMPVDLNYDLRVTKIAKSPR